jgi:hypothetical protein
LDAPELKGDVGIGERGLTSMASEKVGLDFGLQG